MISIERKGFREFIFVVLTLAISTVASLYSIETYLRYAFHVSDLVAGYYPLGNSLAGAKIKMVQREYSINLDFNNQGFRDKEFSFERGSERRVLFLGDSFVEGTGVSVEKRASSLVEKILQKNVDSHFRVINAGQLATNPISYFENFIQFGVALSPELIVVGVFMGNDFQNSRASPAPNNYSVVERYVPRGPVSEIPSFVSLGYLRSFISGIRNGKPQLVKSEITDRFWDYYFKEKIGRDFYIQKTGGHLLQYEAFEKLYSQDVLQDFYQGKLNPSYFIGAVYSHESKPEQLYDAKDIKNVVDIIRVMNAECISRGIKLLVVTYPDIFQVAQDEYSHHLTKTLHMSKVPERMRQLKELRLNFLNNLKANKITHVDLTPALGVKDYYLFDGHLNESGQAIAANLINIQLKSELLVDAQPLISSIVYKHN